MSDSTRPDDSTPEAEEHVDTDVNENASTPAASGDDESALEATGAGPGRPAGSQGVVGDLEDGLGHLLAGLERGFMSLINPDPEAMESANAERAAAAAAHDPEPVEIPYGRTYEEAVGPIRWRALLLGLGAAALLLVLYVGLTFAQVWAAADNDETQPVDAIVVLGAAQFDGEPSPVLKARLDRAFELWSDDVGPSIVTTGSNQEGDRFTEGFSGFVYLRDLGVPESAIIVVVDGDDTWQQLSATALQFDERDLTSALLVSDGYHNFRLLEIADEVGLEAYVSPTTTEATTSDYVRETVAVSLGRIVGFRQLSANAPD